MPVYRGNPLVSARLQQLRCDDLLDRENNTVLTPDTDRGAPILYRLDCIFDLEVAAVGRKDGIGKIVTSSYGRLFLGNRYC